MITNTAPTHPLASALSGLRVASVELAVASLDRSTGFYSGILGLRVLSRDDEHVSLGSTDAGELLRLVVATAGPAPERATGLFHTAIRYPTRADLADALARLVRAQYPITGASDHGPSEALYLDDPDGHGVELTWDRPRAEWKYDAAGNLEMGTWALDARGLLAAAPQPAAPDELGHVHLKVSSVANSLDFYVGKLGLDQIANFGTQAGFISADGYHHHLGMNIWQSAGGSPAPAGTATLRRFTLALRDRAALEVVRAHFAETAPELLVSAEPDRLLLRDPDGTLLELRPSAS